MILDFPSSMIEVDQGQDWIIEMINNILIEVLASMAEQERLTIRKRQREGIDVAKKKGKNIWGDQDLKFQIIFLVYMKHRVKRRLQLRKPCKIWKFHLVVFIY